MVENNSNDSNIVTTYGSKWTWWKEMKSWYLERDTSPAPARWRDQTLASTTCSPKTLPKAKAFQKDKLAKSEIIFLKIKNKVWKNLTLFLCFLQKFGSISSHIASSSPRHGPSSSLIRIRQLLPLP